MIPLPDLQRKVPAICCVLTLAPAVIGAAKPQSHEERGVIKTIDASAHTLVLTDAKDHHEQTFHWNAHSKFLEHGKAVAGTGLKSGEHIRLTYKTSDGQPTIERAQLQPAKSAKSKTAKPKPAKA